MTQPPAVIEMRRVADRPAALAVGLARRGAMFVIVGSTANRLVTGSGLPADLDIRVSRGEVPALARALVDLAASLDRPQRLLTQSHARFVTWLGPVDVFVDDSTGPQTKVVVGGTTLWVTTVAQPVTACTRTPDRRPR